MSEAVSYEGSKKLMYFVENTDYKELLAEIVAATVEGLS